MKKRSWVLLIGVLVAAMFVYGCGKGDVSGGGGSGDHNDAISASDLFDVSGATAVAMASSSDISTSDIRASQTSTSTELLKVSAAGEISSIFSEQLGSSWHPPVSVIEVGPDGSLYIGFQWGIWVTTDSSTDESGGKSVSFFRVKTDGTVEIVDDEIYGVGSWYGYSENGELPAKQVQFDDEGNIYYLGSGNSGTTVLKKKTVDGTISQIGNDNMAVRDFLVCPNGFVLFHGSNAGSWNIEWLRVINTSNAVNNIFYNDGNSGWLRAYYNYVYGGVNYVFLVGENLTLLDENGIPQKYAGIIRVALDSTGKPSSVEAIYDDYNMYNETYNTVGDQLTWGYWDPVEMSNKKFFVTDDYGQVALPLSLEAGVTEASIRSFIRKKYQTIASDTLDTVSFAGTTTVESDRWRINYILDDLVTANISGVTWTKWREDNGLQGIQFGNAKQLVFADSGALYAVISLDNWGAGTSKGDKLFQVVNISGEAGIVAFPQDTVNYYKSMSKVRAFGNYAIYLSNKVGYYKILRLTLSDPTQAPVDMIPDKTNIEIFSFNYDSSDGMLLYDVYDLDNNTSYLAQQAITSTTVATEISAEGYTITDVVPFTAAN
jgi:hypothetical protein